MKKWCASVLLCAALLLGPSAQAAGSVLVDGAPLENNASAQVRNNTTYVSLRTVAQALRPTATAVSYTHLDVYKRQGPRSPP